MATRKVSNTLIVEEDLVAQEFNLSELLGYEVDESLAEQIGRDIADYIRERAADNLGIGGKKLRSPYSKSYQESSEFAAYGKSANDVNMKLTGEMLESLRTLDYDGEILTIGIEGDQAPKAHGHMTGKNGEVPKMKREFFGLTDSELKPILKQYKTERARTVGQVLTREESQQINRLFRNIEDAFSIEEE